MSGFDFEPDRLGIEKVLAGPEMGVFLTGVAKLGKERVQRHAPRGFYEYHKNVRFVPAKLGTDGLTSAVEVTSPGWHLPEFGTARYPAKAPLRRGVEESGVRFDGSAA